jgi:hypothetical protein
LNKRSVLIAIAILNLLGAVTLIVFAVNQFERGSHTIALLLFIAAFAAAIASVGLWNLKNWGRQSAIVLWLACIALIAPPSLLVAFRQFGTLGAVLGLALAVGIPASVVFYLSQSDVKQLVGAPEVGYSRAKTSGLILGTVVAGVLLFAWLVVSILSAIGRGVR